MELGDLYAYRCEIGNSEKLHHIAINDHDRLGISSDISWLLYLIKCKYLNSFSIFKDTEKHSFHNCSTSKPIGSICIIIFSSKKCKDIFPEIVDKDSIRRFLKNNGNSPFRRIKDLRGQYNLP
jgi:hypothetical protein